MAQWQVSWRSLYQEILGGESLANWWNYADATCDVSGTHRTKCDVVLLVPAGDSDNLHCFERAKQLTVWIVQQLKIFTPQIRAEVHFHRLTRIYALQLSATHIGLLKGAELCRLKKRVKPRLGGVLRDFAYDEAHLFDGADERRANFFSSAERALIVRRIVETIRAPVGGLRCRPAGDSGPPIAYVPEGRTLISTLAAQGMVKGLFPIHETSELAALRRVWLSGGWFQCQPLDAIKNYFGVEIALYFAWLEHFTVALCVPAILGIALSCYNSLYSHKDKGDSDMWLSDVLFALFALANCIWATAYGELWKRRQAELAFKWDSALPTRGAGAGGFGDADNFYLLDDPRPEFKGDSIERNPVTGVLEPRCASWKQALIRYGVTYPVTAACILIVLALLFCMLRLQDAIQSQVESSPLIVRALAYLPTVAQALIILLADHFYRYLALFFNDLGIIMSLENYRTDEQFERFLITKIAVFQCVNAFGSLFYVAFYLRDLRRLQETLATLLITRQLLQNVGEMAAPLLKERLHVARLTIGSGSRGRMTSIPRSDVLKRIFDEFRHRRFQGTLPVTTAVTALDGDNGSNAIQRPRQNGALSPISERLPLPEFKPATAGDERRRDEVELQSVMTDYARPLDDYLEIFIQFGYVLLFAPAFPLAAACALVNNLFEMRVDAFKLCYTLRRPFPRQVRSIGAWQNAMQLMSAAGVIVNCALIAQSGLVERLLAPAGLSPAARLIALVAVEHFVFALRLVIDAAVPDVPYWVRVEMAKLEHRRREACKQNCGTTTIASAKSTDDCAQDGAPDR